jgi:hypothetical protein
MVCQGICGLYVDVLAKKILPCPDPTKEYFYGLFLEITYQETIYLFLSMLFYYIKSFYDMIFEDYIGFVSMFWEIK